MSQQVTCYVWRVSPMPSHAPAVEGTKLANNLDQTTSTMKVCLHVVVRAHVHEERAPSTPRQDQHFLCSMYLMRLAPWHNGGPHPVLLSSGDGQCGDADLGKIKFPVVKGNEGNWCTECLAVLGTGQSS